MAEPDVAAAGPAAGELRVSRELLQSLVDEDLCWFDHHGGCQGHGYLSLEPGEVCPQQQLKTLLSSTEEPDEGAVAGTGTEWGAKWSDGGYCPSNPPRSEEFARTHARRWGTRPIRREVGPWVYADTGEAAFPTDETAEG